MAKMNTNGNAYTIIYASVMVIIVAFLLAFVASALKPTQDANVALDTKKQIDGLHLVFIELPKFKPQSFAEKRMAVLWLKFLTEIDEKTRTAPQELLDNPEVSKALEIVEESAYSDAELAAYDGYWDAVRVEATIMGELNDVRAELAEERKKLDAAKAANLTLSAEEAAGLEKAADSLELKVIRYWEKEMK